MFCFTTVIFFYLILTLSSSAEVYEIWYSNGIVLMDIGTPKQVQMIMPTVVTDVLMIVDVNCGKNLNSECPEYCYDILLQDIFCRADCQEARDFGDCRKHLHWDVPRYDPANSTTFEQLTEPWTDHVGYETTQFGLFVRDDVLFRVSDFSSKSPLEMKSFKFVDGLLLDPRMLSTNALLGLAPGQFNFVMLLYEQKKITSPVISILWSSEKMLIGEYEQSECTNWTRRKVASPNWVLEFDSIKLNDKPSNSTVYVATFDFSAPSIYIPNEDFDQLIADKVIESYESRLYKIACNATLDLQFVINGKRFFVPSSILIIQHPMSSLCFPRLLPVSRWYLKPRLYNDEPNWILGRTFLKQFCVGYDYEAKELGIADFVDS
ncbi:Eukaryotic aspartyl protease [Aphelenchoides besseyi]|nr:Eukaryotic aspartyl protease [Aphelenchoides besseyi]